MSDVYDTHRQGIVCISGTSRPDNSTARALGIVVDELPLQRHLSVLTKSTHVESRFCGHSRQVKAAFCTPVNPCVRSVCSRSVVVGLLPRIPEFQTQHNPSFYD